jgi:hypothetical protein
MEKVKRKYLELCLGLILLIPPVYGVASFSLRFVGVNLPLIRTYSITDKDKNTASGKDQIASYFWIGRENLNSPIPIYFGLMAIAGALLINNSTKK